MANLEDDVLVTGGVIAAAWFLVVKPIMGTFSLSAEDAEALQTAQNTTPSENPFSAQFQPLVDIFADGGGEPINEYMVNLKAAYYDQYTGEALTVNFANPPHGHDFEIVKAGEVINDAFAFFQLHGVQGNRDAVEQIFYTIPAQIDVAYIAAYLFYNYGTDLWHVLKSGGWAFLYGLPAEDLVTISKRIYSLPVQ